MQYQIKPALTIFTLILVSLHFSSCSNKVDKDFISSAVLESQTFQIATTAQGQITDLYQEEGQSVQKGDLVAQIDTLPYRFKIGQLKSAQAELAGNTAAKKGEIASHESDLRGLEREYQRSAELSEKGSVPSQQKDNLQTQVTSAKLRISANKQLLSAFGAKKVGLQTQIAEIADQLRRCSVYAPATGTILTRYKNRGEIAMPGNPFYEMARYDTMQVDFYVPQPLVAGFTLGQKIRLRLDDATVTTKEKSVYIPATICWISNDAEFTPKNIQTRESRNELVFKIRALAANTQGLLKRGLPVEVWR